MSRGYNKVKSKFVTDKDSYDNVIKGVVGYVLAERNKFIVKDEFRLICANSKGEEEEYSPSRTCTVRHVHQDLQLDIVTIDIIYESRTNDD